MKKFYMLLITYPGSGTQLIMNTGNKAVAADEDNKHLLIDMGNKLLDQNVISSYTLMTNADNEVNRFTGVNNESTIGN